MLGWNIRVGLFLWPSLGWILHPVWHQPPSRPHTFAPRWNVALRLTEKLLWNRGWASQKWGLENSRCETSIESTNFKTSTWWIDTFKIMKHDETIYIHLFGWVIFKSQWIWVGSVEFPVEHVKVLFSGLMFMKFMELGGLTVGKNRWSHVQKWRNSGYSLVNWHNPCS